MLKKVFFGAAAVALVAGLSVTTTVTAEAGTCRELAKAKYPDNVRERLSYKRTCRRAEKEGLLTRIKIRN